MKNALILSSDHSIGFFARVKNILLYPKTEWELIAEEEQSATAVFVSYTLPLIVISAATAFIGFTFFSGAGSNLEALRRIYSIPSDAINYSRIHLSERGFTETIALTFGVYYAFQIAVIGATGFWLAALVVNLLAPKFGSEKNMARSMKLAAYAMTPIFVGGLLMIFPPIRIIGQIFGLYGFYLLYLGLPQLMKTPQEKIISYAAIAGLISLAIGVGFVLLFPTIFTEVIAPVLGRIQISARPDK